jgi:peptide/nickel transport system permease protein
MSILQTEVAGPPTRRRTPSLVVVLAAIVLVLLVAAALVPRLFTAADPLATDTTLSATPPSAAHLFGTDRLGRDVLSRVVHGASTSLSFGVTATVVAVVLGTVIGVASGLAPRWLDTIIQRALEILLALPELLIALVIVAILGASTVNLVVAITLAAIPSYARLVRGTTLQVRQAAYVEAGTALGQRRSVVILRHVLPNVVGPLLVLATIGIGTAIISGSGLSFLGLGPSAPSSEWGLMLSDGRGSLASAWWVAVFPGLAITATVISTTLLGRRLQARFEGTGR